MARPKASDIEVKRFATHHVITQPNPLRKVLRRVDEKDADDPVARAEKALADLSGEFKDWMLIEADRLVAAHAALVAVVSPAPVPGAAVDHLAELAARGPPRLEVPDIDGRGAAAHPQDDDALIAAAQLLGVGLDIAKEL